MIMSTPKQITYNTAGTIVTLFCQWMILMIIPKITAFSDAGVFAVALSICSILNIVATFQLNQQQISDQYVRYTENDYRAVRSITITLSFVLCIFVVLFFNYTMEQNLVIIFYMVYRNLLHYAYLYTATLQIRGRLDHVGKCMMLEGAVSFISFTASYYFTNDLVSSTLIMAVLGGGIFLATVAHGYRKAVGRKYPRHRADRSATSSLIKLGIPLLLSIIAPTIITALPRIILQVTDGNEIVGIFGTLSTPTIVIPTLVLGIFTPFIVYFSNLCRRGDMMTLRRQYLKMAGLALILGVFGYILSHFAAEPLFEMIYGDDIVPYVWSFKVIVMGITFYSVGMWGITVLITKEQGRCAAIASAISLAIALAIFITIIPKYHFDGAVFALVVAYGIFGIIVSLFVLIVPLRGTVTARNREV